MTRLSKLKLSELHRWLLQGFWFSAIFVFLVRACVCVRVCVCAGVCVCVFRVLMYLRWVLQSFGIFGLAFFRVARMAAAVLQV